MKQFMNYSLYHCSPSYDETTVCCVHKPNNVTSFCWNVWLCDLCYGFLCCWSSMFEDLWFSFLYNFS